MNDSVILSSWISMCYVPDHGLGRCLRGSQTSNPRRQAWNHACSENGSILEMWLRMGRHTGCGFTSAGRGCGSKGPLQLSLEELVARGERCSQKDPGVTCRVRCSPGELEGAWDTTPGLGLFSEGGK